MAFPRRVEEMKSEGRMAARLRTLNLSLLWRRFIVKKKASLAFPRGHFFILSLFHEVSSFSSQFIPLLPQTLSPNDKASIKACTLY